MRCGYFSARGPEFKPAEWIVEPATQLLRLRLYPGRALCAGSRETSSDHEHVPFDEGPRESGSKRASH
ncbi:conserved hypothetical protein [Ricinus communis]|uniref:Uncharacterized protein n=1 Tax=Ricinus communis TaxID=3988 RepID=B9SZ22_RICCO|nr:conserved hypothetical protein [Ricinus communis]